MLFSTLFTKNETSADIISESSNLLEEIMPVKLDEQLQQLYQTQFVNQILCNFLEADKRQRNQHFLSFVWKVLWLVNV